MQTFKKSAISAIILSIPFSVNATGKPDTKNPPVQPLVDIGDFKPTIHNNSVLKPTTYFVDNSKLTANQKQKQYQNQEQYQKQSLYNENYSNSDSSSYSKSKAVALGGNAKSFSEGGDATSKSSSDNTNDVTNNLNDVGNTSNNIPRQAPMAYAPNTAVGFNPYICSNTASFGASSPFGGVSLGIPITADNCPILVLADYLYKINQPVQGCEILNQIDEIREVREKTGFSCIGAATVVTPTPAKTSTWLEDFNRKYPPIDVSPKLDTIYKQEMYK